MDYKQALQYLLELQHTLQGPDLKPTLDDPIFRLAINRAIEALADCLQMGLAGDPY